MAAKVIYKQGTKQTYLGLSEWLPNALYFCTDTQELYKGDALYTDALRIVDSKDALPAPEIAADGKIYYCKDTGICYVLNEARDGWFTPFLGYDNETIAPDASGLLAVKAVPLSRVTGLQDELKRLEEKINAGGGSNLKPGDEFSVAQDGTFSVKTIDVRKITGLETRLNSLENSLEWGEM